MIIPIKFEDLDSVMKDMGDSFYTECELPGGFSIEAFIHNWRLLIQGNIGAMWKVVLENKSVAYLGGILMPDINNGKLVATELFWYVHPDFRKSTWGLKLFSNFEKWAVSVKATRIVMAHLHNAEGESLSKFYKHRGYKAIEIHYSKDL